MVCSYLAFDFRTRAHISYITTFLVYVNGFVFVYYFAADIDFVFWSVCSSVLDTGVLVHVEG